jgi:hypothetical protein
MRFCRTTKCCGPRADWVFRIQAAAQPTSLVRDYERLELVGACRECFFCTFRLIGLYLEANRTGPLYVGLSSMPLGTNKAVNKEMRAPSHLSRNGLTGECPGNFMALGWLQERAGSLVDRLPVCGPIAV